MYEQTSVKPRFFNCKLTLWWRHCENHAVQLSLMKNRNKNIPSHKAYKKAKKEHKKDFHRLHHLSVTCFVAETNKQKPKNDTNDQNENGRLDFMEEATWGGLRIPRHIWTHFTSIVTLITTTFRRGRVTFRSHGNRPFERVTFHFESITLLFERYRIAFRTHFVTFRTYFVTFFMFRYFTKRNFSKRDFATDGAPYKYVKLKTGTTNMARHL